MFDILFIGILVLFSVILGFEGIKKWRKLGQTSYLIGGVISILAGLVFFVDLSTGFYVLALAMLIRIVVGFVSRRSESEQMEGSHEIKENEAR